MEASSEAALETALGGSLDGLLKVTPFIPEPSILSRVPSGLSETELDSLATPGTSAIPGTEPEGSPMKLIPLVEGVLNKLIGSIPVSSAGCGALRPDVASRIICRCSSVNPASEEPGVEVSRPDVASRIICRCSSVNPASEEPGVEVSSFTIPLLVSTALSKIGSPDDPSMPTGSIPAIIPFNSSSCSGLIALLPS